MSIATGPFALTVGQALGVPLPASGQYSAVVVQNLSPYLLQVNNGPDEQWLAPFTAQVYPTNTGQSPLSVTPKLLPGTTVPAGASSAVVATFYNTGEPIDGTYPLSLTANAVSAAIAGAVSITSGVINNQQPQALLGSLSFNTHNAVSATYVLPANAQSLMLMSTLTNNTAPTFTVAMTVTGTTTGELYFDGVIAPNDFQFCPVSPVVDPSVLVQIIGTSNPVAFAPLTIYTVARSDPALTSLAGVPPGYQTNRFQPVIASSGNPLQAATAASGQLLGALSSPPNYPNQYRLWALTLDLSLTSGSGTAVITMTSPSVNLLRNSHASLRNAVNAQFGSGLVLPIGCGLTVTAAGTGSAAAATVIYDTVGVAV